MRLPAAVRRRPRRGDVARARLRFCDVAVGDGHEPSRHRHRAEAAVEGVVPRARNGRRPEVDTAHVHEEAARGGAGGGRERRHFGRHVVREVDRRRVLLAVERDPQRDEALDRPRRRLHRRARRKRRRVALHRADRRARWRRRVGVIGAVGGVGVGVGSAGQRVPVVHAPSHDELVEAAEVLRAVEQPAAHDPHADVPRRRPAVRHHLLERRRCVRDEAHAVGGVLLAIGAHLDVPSRRRRVALRRIPALLADRVPAQHGGRRRRRVAAKRAAVAVVACRRQRRDQGVVGVERAGGEAQRRLLVPREAVLREGNHRRALLGRGVRPEDVVGGREAAEEALRRAAKRGAVDREQGVAGGGAGRRRDGGDPRVFVQLECGGARAKVLRIVRERDGGARGVADADHRRRRRPTHRSGRRSSELLVTAASDAATAAATSRYNSAVMAASMAAAEAASRSAAAGKSATVPLD